MRGCNPRGGSPLPKEAPLDRAAFARAVNVSRETLDRLEAHLDLLRRWQGAINLVSPGSLADPWRRHVLDSAQLIRYLPAGAESLVDLGSGAGFPGLVLAIMGVPGVHLVESDRRKAAFLAEAARVSGAPVTIHPERIEALGGWPADVVSARAVAPLPRLLDLAERFIDGQRTVCLFLKGARVGRELTEAARSWHMLDHTFASLSDPTGVVLKLQDVSRAPHHEP